MKLLSNGGRVPPTARLPRIDERKTSHPGIAKGEASSGAYGFESGERKTSVCRSEHLL
jgi:hypothetical protein